MSPPASQALPASFGPARFLARSAALVAGLVAPRRTYSAPSVAEQATADLTSLADWIPAELPGLVGALAIRGAMFGPHRVQVAA